jgi:hypothetical protein
MAGQTPEGPAPEQPVLWLGMVGFSPAQRTTIEAAVTRGSSHARWRISAFGAADGWWVNGAKCSIIRGDRLKIAPGLPTEHTLKLELKEVDRPLAFAQPIAPTDLEALCVFDPESDDSIRAALEQFERWLLRLRNQFVLGELLLKRDTGSRRGTYHLTQRGTLLAVLDFQQGAAAIAPRAHPNALWEAAWERRPPAAGQPPQGFFKCTIPQLAWSYVRRTDRDMLPSRYRSEVIYYRHVPRVPLRWLRDSQLMLLRELSAQPGTLQALRERTAVPLEDLTHDLACLYYAGSVTTTPETAGQHLVRDDSTNGSSVGLWPEGPPSDANPAPPHDLTAPALLERRNFVARETDDWSPT